MQAMNNNNNNNNNNNRCIVLLVELVHCRTSLKVSKCTVLLETFSSIKIMASLLFLLMCSLHIVGTKAYDKLNSLLTNVHLVNDIKKLSPDSQTSCLDGFHSTLNHWHPKMVCFSWLGT